MHPRFLTAIEQLEPKFQQLVTMAPVRYGAISVPVPDRGIYLFSEGHDHLYVGRTNRLRGRLRDHCSPGGDHNKATFAFFLARHETGRRATYTKSGSRKELCLDSIFGPTFTRAKERVSRMDIRFVEEGNATSQALLEIYVATVLGARYNDFDNH